MATIELASDVLGWLAIGATIIGLIEWRFRILQKDFDDRIERIRKCIDRVEKRYDDHVDRGGGGSPIK